MKLSATVKKKSTKIVKSLDNFGWVDAVKDAERRIQEYESKIEDLKAAIRVCKQRVQAGEPWPGKVSTQ